MAHVLAMQVGWLIDAGWECVVACDPDSKVARLTRERGGRVAPWRAQRSPTQGVLTEMRALRRIVVDTNPDLVHLHSSKAGLVGRLTLRGSRPTVFQPHAWSFEATSGVLNVASTGWERYAERWTAVTVCVSDAERLRGAQSALFGRMVVLNNSVDAQRFYPVEAAGPSRTALRRALGVAPDRPLAVCLGRLCPQKGQDLLLTAWRTVTKALPQAQLALVGDGPDQATLAAQAPESVQFVGAVEDPVPWLQAADVVVVPSRWEGQALVVLEAMACGVPVVASDIGPNVETLPPVAGALVSTRDPERFGQAVRDRLSSSRRAVGEGQAGRAHVVAHHDPAGAAEQLTRLYSSLLTPVRIARRSPV